MKLSQSVLCPPLHLPTLWGILLYFKFLGTVWDKPRREELGWISPLARWGAEQLGNTNTSLVLLLKSVDNNVTLIHVVMLPTFPEEFKWKQEMTKKFKLASWQKPGFIPQKGPSLLQQRSAPVPKAAEATEGPTHRSEFWACWTHNYKNKINNCYQPAVQYRCQQYPSSRSHVLLYPRTFASCKCSAQGNAVCSEALWTASTLRR